MKMFLFRDNKYSRYYARLIEKARSEPRKKGQGTYYEVHHAVPKSMGGGLGSNLVLLTGREHFLAHLLLVRMTTGPDNRKMCHALWQFCVRGSGGLRHVPTSRQFAESRKLKAEATKEQMTGMIISDAHRAKISAARMGVSTGARSNDQKANYSISKTGALNPSAKQCIVDGTVYDTMRDAIKKLNLPSKHALRKLPTFCLVNEDGSLDDSTRWKPKTRTPMSEEQRQKLRVLATGRHLSSETRAKLSVASIGRISPRKGKAATEAEKRQKSKPVRVRGVQYYGLTEACKKTGRTAYDIKKDPSFMRLA
jgi:hypothetical protein